MTSLVIAWIDVASNAIKQNLNSLWRDTVTWRLMLFANMSHSTAVQQGGWRWSMVAQCSSSTSISKSAVVDNNSATTFFSATKMQAISYHSNVDTESHLLADESSFVL